jgi:hypothetical protein
VDLFFLDVSMESALTIFIDFSAVSSFFPDNSLVLVMMLSSSGMSEFLLQVGIFTSDVVEFRDFIGEIIFEFPELFGQSVDLDGVRSFQNILLIFILFLLQENFFILLIFDLQDLVFKIFQFGQQLELLGSQGFLSLLVVILLHFSL